MIFLNQNPSQKTIKNFKKNNNNIKASTASINVNNNFNEMIDEIQQISLKPIAFAAVVFSTVAVTACLLTFPLVFHYVQTLQATVQVKFFFKYFFK